jgi:hypothetical protein
MKQEWSRRELYARGEPFGECATQRKVTGGYVCGGGGKGSPPPPDYMAAAQEQARASREVTNMQNFANRPNQTTPWGSTTWTTSKDVDPATGQEVTRWNQNTALTPQLQQALDAQIGIQNQRSGLAGSFMDRVRSEYGRPFDYSNMPAFSFASSPQNMTTSVATQGLQRGLNMGDNPALPQFDSNYRDTVARSLMERMVPVHERQQSQLETRLANQGLQVGSEAYTRALADLGQRQAAERFNALDTAGAEAQRLFQMGMGARQQAFQEDVGAGQFGNQAAAQAFQQDVAAGNFGNQAMQNMYNMNRAAAMDQNAVRQQMIAEQMQRRGMSLNEMNALLSGQQVSMPQMPGFQAAQRSETPNILGATQMGYDAALGAANAQNAGTANMLGGLGQLGQMAFMFSDRRLKSNIRRVGTHSIGVGIYDFEMMGVEQRGVIAQEVRKVRPDLVKRHASGYLMVNYGGL